MLHFAKFNAFLMQINQLTFGEFGQIFTPTHGVKPRLI